eukprot:COSAG06_NODE_71988_length_176_cov_129.896104_1_plen_46_part_10
MVITHIVAANCDDPPTGEPPQASPMGVLEQPKIKDFNNVSDVFQGG